MSLRVIFLPEAALEAEEAIEWYEAQRRGLGLAFLAAVDRTVEHIARWPKSGSPVPGVDDQLEARRVRVPAFPYHLTYLTADATAHVLAVAHERRLPGYWHSRAGAPLGGGDA